MLLPHKHKRNTDYEPQLFPLTLTHTTSCLTHPSAFSSSWLGYPPLAAPSAANGPASPTRAAPKVFYASSVAPPAAGGRAATVPVSSCAQTRTLSLTLCPISLPLTRSLLFAHWPLVSASPSLSLAHCIVSPTTLSLTTAVPLTRSLSSLTTLSFTISLAQSQYRPPSHSLTLSSHSLSLSGSLPFARLLFAVSLSLLSLAHYILSRTLR